MSESLSFPNLPFHCCVPQQFLEIKKKERNKIVHGLLSHKDLSIFAGRPSLSFSDWTNQETNVALCTCYLSLLLLSLSIYFLARSSLLFSPLIPMQLPVYIQYIIQYITNCKWLLPHCCILCNIRNCPHHTNKENKLQFFLNSWGEDWMLSCWVLSFVLVSTISADIILTLIKSKTLGIRLLAGR